MVRHARVVSKVFPAPVDYREYLEGFLPIDLHKIRPKGFYPMLNKTYKVNAAKVSKKHGWRTVARCPLCHSAKRTREITKFGYDYVRCDACGLRYMSKMPRVPEDVYCDESYLPETITLANDYVYRKERFARERIRLITGFIGNPRGKRILDVGCGTGLFLETAVEAGFIASGQDLGTELARWTSRRLSIPIYSQPVAELVAEEKFDVITLFDVIEHVPDPGKFILDCRKLLKDKGIIVVFTPNYESLAVNTLKEMTTFFAPGEHLIFFTRKAVGVLASKTRMNLAYYCTRGCDMGDMGMFYDWIGRKELGRACMELYDKIQPLIDSVGAANHMRFILKK